MLTRRPVLGALAGGLFSASLPSLAAAQPRPLTGAGMTFRWFNNAGFEVVLPSGAHVLIDPWLDSAPYNPLPVASLERADYILISHIHGDHSDDVGAIQKRFPKVRIFVGSLSAEPLARQHNLDVSRLYKVGDGQEFHFGEVAIKAFGGRHTESSRGNHLQWDEKGELAPQSWGTLDLWQYLITLPDGTKFMVWAGTPSVDNAYKLEGIKPDIAAVHISPKQDFRILGEIIRRMGPKVVIPHHYDIWPTILQRMPAQVTEFPQEVQPVTPDNVVGKMMPYVERTLRTNGMSAPLFVPKNHVWYRYERRSGTIKPA